MDLIITEWALNSYLSLKGKQAFSSDDYWNTFRPDILLLKDYPNPTRFGLQQFWSPATIQGSGAITNGYKMKWDQVGNGKIELRLPVGMPPVGPAGEVFLCEAYHKKNSKQEKRMLARFKTHLQLIKNGNYRERGRL